MAFHIHVPKPLHGWKAFLNEISVIVIGVLIALALEAGVEELHWQNKAADGKERIHEELSLLGAAAAEQIVTAPCIKAQLGLLESKILQSRSTIDPSQLYRDSYVVAAVKIPRRNWQSLTWDALQQDGTTSHLSPELQQHLGSLYQQVAQLREMSMQSQQRLGAMRLAGTALPLTPEIRASLLQDFWLQADRTVNGAVIAAQIIARARAIGLAPSDAQIDARLADMARGNGMNPSTMQYCLAQNLPLGDWRAEVAKVRLSAIR